jgi:uncharacterized protein YbaA (DUF1428 family)
MQENIYFAAFFFPSLAAVLIFSMKYVAAIVQARTKLAQDEAYREIAAKATAAQAETVATLGSVVATLADVQAKLNGLEKILKEVE